MLRYDRLVGVLSMSLQDAVGSRLVGAVGSRLAGAVGLRGFASPDVLKYRLSILGVPVVDYSHNVLVIFFMMFSLCFNSYPLCEHH